AHDSAVGARVAGAHRADPAPTRAPLVAAGMVALLVAGCIACAWVEGAPLTPADAGRAGGGSLGWLFLACLVLGFAVYVGALLLLRRRGAGLRAVVAAAAVIQLLPLAGPLLLSTDAWTYWEYGRIAAVHGADPYVDEPSRFPNDPAYDDAGADWRDTTSVYGPAFTLLSEGVALVSGSSEAAAAWIFKALAAAGMLACVLLAAALARDRPLAAALVGWNPLFAVHFAGGGHNDSLLVALTLGALAFAARGRRQAAGGAWALAVLVKWIPLVFFALRAVAARAEGRRVGHAGFAAAAAIVAGLATWRYGVDWLRSFGPLARNIDLQSSYALPHRLEQMGVPHDATLVLATAVLAAGLAWLARQAWRGRVRLGLAGCLLLATTPWLTPWYAIWAVPLAAAEDDRRAQLIALGFCAYLLPQTVPL
ncbi:MAG: glycosyltransferase 87 family protein, partial [Gaiellaceae bacterium]